DSHVGVAGSAEALQNCSAVSGGDRSMQPAVSAHARKSPAWRRPPTWRRSSNTAHVELGAQIRVNSNGECAGATDEPGVAWAGARRRRPEGHVRGGREVW